MSNPKRVSMAPGGPEVSRIAYGVWRLLEDPQGAGTERVLAKIEACLERGITTFDHADIYGGYRVEEAFGQALRARPALRERMEIVTKCGIMLVNPARPQNRLKHYDYSAAHLEASVERSLHNLGTDRIDVLLLHRPSPLFDADEVPRAIERLRAAGKVLHVGVSNFTPSQLELLASRLPSPPVTNQVEIHPLRLDAFLDGTLDQCQRLRIAPMAWSPTAGGWVFRGHGEREERVRRALFEVGQKLGTSPEGALYAWLLRHPARIIPVLGTNQLERVAVAAGALELQMDTQDWFAIWSASTGGEVP